MDKFNYSNLTPFKWFVLQNFPFIEGQFDAITNWQLFEKLGREINKLINSENTLGSQVEDVTNAFIELKNYIDNLDLQDEVNSKLDQMVLDGTLGNIIGTYVDDYVENTTNAINKINNELKMKGNNIVSLQNYIIYDGLDSEYTQGSCVDPDTNTLYVYKTNTNGNGGSILVFNNERLTSTINNVNFYHGNSLEFIDNKIYAASFDNKKIVVYNLANATTTELLPFENITEYNKVTAISKIDNENLLCLLFNTENFASSDKLSTFYKLNLTTGLITEIPITNTKNIRLDYYASQSMCYNNNHLYLLTSYPSTIIDYVLINNNFNVNSIHLIPMRDKLGLLVGEIQDISITQYDDYYLLTSHVVDGTDRVLKTHFLSFNSNLSPTYYQYVDTDIDAENYRQNIYVDNSPTAYTLYEDGSAMHPFKTIRRAIASANYGKFYVRKTLQIRSRGIEYPYTIGTIYNINNIIINNRSNFGTLYITGNTLLINCNITIQNEVDDCIVIDNIELRNTQLKSTGARLYLNGLVNIKQSSTLTTTYVNQANQSNTTPFILENGCTLRTMINGNPSTTSNYVFQIFGDSYVISNLDPSKVTLGAGGLQGVYIKVGNKLGS